MVPCGSAFLAGGTPRRRLLVSFDTVVTTAVLLLTQLDWWHGPVGALGPPPPTSQACKLHASFKQLQKRVFDALMLVRALCSSYHTP